MSDTMSPTGAIVFAACLFGACLVLSIVNKIVEHAYSEWQWRRTLRQVKRLIEEGKIKPNHSIHRKVENWN